MDKSELLDIVKDLIDNASFDGEDTDGWFEDAQAMSFDELLEYAKDLGYDPDL